MWIGKQKVIVHWTETKSVDKIKSSSIAKKIVLKSFTVVPDVQAFDDKLAELQKVKKLLSDKIVPW